MDYFSKKRYSIAFLFSLIMHILILLIFILSFKKVSNVSIVGQKENNILSSYLIRQNDATNSLHAAIHVVSKNKDIKKISKNNTNKIISYFHNNEKNNTNQAIDGDHSDELITLLHQAIQAQQQYPENAIEMQRSGVVTVEFNLYLDGDISNLKLIKSSGTDDLDQAALAAVQDAAPFKDVDKYLKNQHQFIIDVVFDLSS